LASSFSGGADAVSALQAGGGGQGAVLLFLLTLVGKRSALVKMVLSAFHGGAMCATPKIIHYVSRMNY
jgi:hypothetical protein